MRALALTLTTLVACRPDPGAPAYGNPDPWDPVGDDPDFLGGSTPWEEGTPRLSIGIFYEGGASHTLPIDEVTRHFYIYESTFGLTASDDRVEGLVADTLSLAGTPWWGGGVHWDEPADLSEWTHLHVALSSDDAAFASWSIGMSDGITEARVDVADHGFVADGAWTELDIPLDAFVGLDRSQVSIALLLVGGPGAAGETLHIDDLYFHQGDR